MQQSLLRLTALIAVSACGAAACRAATRTLEFQTTQVTGASLALSPDSKTIVFSMLGHLFSMAAGGGSANQLTFGPFYDDDPSYSPDGSQVAFVSDRDGSEGNIFVLSLNTSRIVQVTHEEYAGRPVWSPDGASLVYLRYARLPARGRPAVVARVAATGGQPEIVAAPARATCAATLPANWRPSLVDTPQA